MRLFKNNKTTSWKDVFNDSVQVDYAPIPTGETEKYINEEGQEKTRQVTVERPALGFQTETGRGKGIQWIPVEDIEDAVAALQHYAENGVDSVAMTEDWLSPAETIHETITRVPRKDENDRVIEGEYDISFRVRMGKGSKSCRVPEEDFAEFVEMLASVTSAVPAALAKVEARRAAAAAKAQSDE